MRSRGSAAQRANAYSTSTHRSAARASSSGCWSARYSRSQWRRPDMWGIVPAAGRGSRIQPLAFSKELLPVGSKTDAGIVRPCAVSEYLVERLILGGADKICFVIAPGKCDILQYFGDSYGEASTAFVVQPTPGGLCDAIFRAGVVINED